METNNQQEELEELTVEELLARKKEMKQYFEEAVPYLEAQHKYEKMLSEISEFKFKRFQFDTQLTMHMYQLQHPEGLDKEASTQTPPIKKTFKKR